MPDHCASHERFDIVCEECRVARRTSPLRLHDTHEAWCPACRRHLTFTNSPSMLAEFKADGVPADEIPQLVVPIESMFQGTRAQIFPVKCPCGQEWFGFVDLVNREAVAERDDNFRQMMQYDPHLRAKVGAKPEIQTEYLRAKYRMVLVSREEFARRVSLERNHMVREALQRKVDERRLGVEWTRPRLVARLVKE
jgi:hypothetical protein